MGGGSCREDHTPGGGFATRVFARGERFLQTPAGSRRDDGSGVKGGAQQVGDTDDAKDDTGEQYTDEDGHAVRVLVVGLGDAEGVDEDAGNPE